jgi:hypothetical protein
MFQAKPAINAPIILTASVPNGKSTCSKPKAFTAAKRKSVPKSPAHAARIVIFKISTP